MQCINCKHSLSDHYGGGSAQCGIEECLCLGPNEPVTSSGTVPYISGRLRKQGTVLNEIVEECHDRSTVIGWYCSPQTGEEIKRNIPEMLCLIHSEISEALEGYRKNLMDDKLPHRKMIEIELADALIRIADLAGYLNLDLGGAYVEKLIYNETRADHKLENRAQDGGKKF